MKLKILYGVCGLGNGHTFRQLPILEHFSQAAEIMIFGHDNSYRFYASYFKDHPSVKVVEVAIPFYVGSKTGIDFKASQEHPMNQKDIFKINCNALDRAGRELGSPDLVVTDYESISAQYAYAQGAPLVTIDQQSKYLSGNFPEELGGFTYKDEIVRLHMFFPKVEARVALSFFGFPTRSEAEDVLILPPTIRSGVASLRRDSVEKAVLVYVSSAREFAQTPDEIINICSQRKDMQFHIFLGGAELSLVQEVTTPNVSLYGHGDARFDAILGECAGIISTAGHSLLSEAMYLGIPVYAIPVAPYEQHMNAKVVADNGFGISHPAFDSEKMNYFIEHIPEFEDAIRSDKKILKKGRGQDEAVSFLENKFFL